MRETYVSHKKIVWITLTVAYRLMQRNSYALRATMEIAEKAYLNVLYDFSLTDFY